MFNKEEKDLEKFKLAVDNVSDHVIMTDPDGIITYANKAVEKITGYTNSEVIGKKAGSPELWGGLMDLEFYKKMWKTIKYDQKDFFGQLKNKRKNGEFYYSEVRISPILDEKNELIFFVAIERDITDQKKSEDLALKNQALIESIGEISYDHVISDDKITWNGIESLGFTPEEFGDNSESWFGHCHPDDVDAVKKEFESAIKEKRPYDLEYRFITKNGDYRWFLDQGATFFDKENNLTRIVGILKDVTESRIQIEKIKKLSERLKLATDSAEIGVWELNLKDNTLTWDENMYKIYGLDQKNSLTYKEWVNFLLNEDREKSEKAFETAIKEENKFHNIFRITRQKDKKVRYIEAHANIIFDKNKKPDRAVGVNFDVTEQKEIDQAKNEFVSLASHQLRTPLAVIRWYSEMLSDPKLGKKMTDKQKDYINEISEGNKKMIALVNDMLDISKLELGTFSVEDSEVDILHESNEALKEIKIIIKGTKIKIKHKFDKDLPKIKYDKDLLNIILQNLLSNAVKYNSEDGFVEFYVKKEGKFIVIQVIDNGCGIPSDEKDKIFTKFFRAQNIRHTNIDGTGLGLYMVKKIVDLTGGTIRFESKEGEGTSFEIKIPIK